MKITIENSWPVNSTRFLLPVVALRGCRGAPRTVTLAWWTWRVVIHLATTTPRSTEDANVARDFDERITPHILRNWSRERIIRFAKHLLGDACQECMNAGTEARGNRVASGALLGQKLEDGK